jgi:hypothetical protein
MLKFGKYCDIITLPNKFHMSMTIFSISPKGLLSLFMKTIIESTLQKRKFRLDYCGETYHTRNLFGDKSEFALFGA